MRIGLLSQPFDVVVPPVDGRYSIPVLTFNFARELAAHGHAVTVYATAERTAPRSSREQPRIVHFSRPRRLSRLAQGVLRRLSRLSRPRLPFMLSAWFDPLYALQAALDARSRGLQVVHIQNFSQYAAVFKALCPGIKVVLHMHCEWLNQIEPATIRARLRKVDRVLCTSDYIRARAAQALPEFAARMRTLYNGVDVRRFTPAPSPAAAGERTTVCFIGRIAPDKGVHLLIEAFARVVEAFPQAKLCLAGTPELLAWDLLNAYDDPVLRARMACFYGGAEGATPAQRWRATLARLAADHVELLGEQSHTQLIERLRAATLLVQSSIVPESFGMPVAEAMAIGLPVVTTDAGALRELVEHGRTGLVVERGSAASLADAIIALLGAPATARAMGAAGRQQALERFDFATLGLQLEQHYAALLEPRSGAAWRSSLTRSRGTENVQR